MLPDGWRRSTLGEIASISSGGTPDRAESTYWNGDIPWVMTGEIRFNTITDTAEKITKAGLQNSAAKLYPPGTLLMAMYGQGKTRGQVAKLGIAASTNQACAAIVLNDGYEPDFYFQYLAFQYDALREIGNAGTQKNLSGGLIKEVPAPIPPLEEQRMISRVLTKWDEAIDTAICLVDNVQKQKRMLARALLSSRSQTSTGGEWTHIDLDEIFERITAKNSANNTNVLTISAQAGLISQQDYFNKNVASENLLTYTLLERGDFAYNKSYSIGYPMGAIKPLTRYDAGVVSSLYLCFRLRPEATADFDFFRHYFDAGLLNEGIGGIAQEGARAHGLLNVGISDFFKLRLHLPPVSEQRRIAEILNAAEAEKRKMAVRVRLLKQEKRALMSVLLTGKRRIRLPESIAEVSA